LYLGIAVYIMSNLPDNPCCYNCAQELDLPDGAIGRGEECPKCRCDVRVCLNCQFYDCDSYNECSEPMAERVVDKDRRNFCDYFSISKGKRGSSGSKKNEALAALDDLFKK
jgi:hypothetical protein